MNKKVNKKVQSLSSLSKKVAAIKKKGKKVVQCHGVFDIVHLGHIRHFNLAKEEGDVLVVTTTADKHVKRGPGRPIFNQSLRAETLASLEITDYVAIVDEPTAINAIKKIKPDVYVKGSDYKKKDQDVTGMIYDEEEAVTSVGGRLAFTDDITFSSSKLINETLDVFPQRTKKYLEAMNKRYSIDDIALELQSLEKMKVLVIGDTIIDEYHYCGPLGKSSKSDVVVNLFKSDETFAGGVLATANNVASVCGQVDLITVLGTECSHEKFIRGHLKDNINPEFIFREGERTTVKRRYVREETKRKLFEVCFMNDYYVESDVEKQVLKSLKNIKKYDVVIVSDFGHGLMTPKVIEAVSSKAKYLAVNVQTNGANSGFNIVTKYPRANCVCIDELELRFAAQDRFGDVRPLSKEIYQRIKGCDHVIATRGSSGSIHYSKDAGYHECPSFASNVVDAIGAGDAFFAFVAPCFAKGVSPDITSFIGNAVGSLAVQIVCNREPVSKVDLVKFMTRLLK